MDKSRPISDSKAKELIEQLLTNSNIKDDKKFRDNFVEQSTNPKNIDIFLKHSKFYKVIKPYILEIIDILDRVV
jgi:hypothetical protein